MYKIQWIILAFAKIAFKVKRTLVISGYFGIHISHTLKANAHSSVVMVDIWTGRHTFLQHSSLKIPHTVISGRLANLMQNSLKATWFCS